MAGLTTWYCKTFVKLAVETLDIPPGANSAFNAVKAAFVGANTVNGPTPDSIDTKLGCPCPVKAPTSEVKFGLAVACVTIVGKPMTWSTT